MRARKSVSVALVGALFLQTLAPLAYAQQMGGGGGQQPVDPVVANPTDPGDAIIPDNYSDLPIPHPGLGSTNTDVGYSDMWTPALESFRSAIDFTQPPKDPDTWIPIPNPPPGSGSNFEGPLPKVIRDPLPWEGPGSGGSISDGGTLINPPTPPSGGGKGGGGVGPNPGGGGGASGSRGEVSGFMNTNTGMMDFQIPIVSFTGPGQGAVDLALQLKSTTPTWYTNLWTDNYDIRLDISKTTGQAIVTMPSGLTLPFVRTSPPPAPGQVGGEIYQGPMGVRAQIVNYDGLGYQLVWRNGDVWFFGGVNGQGKMGYVTFISYKKGGNISINRTQYATTISTGSRSVTINRNLAQLPSGLSGRITGPNGVTDISSVPTQYGLYPMTITYPGGVKKIKLF